MPSSRRLRFERFAEQLEALAADLNDTKDAEQRRETLQRMKVIIDKVDQLILNELPALDSKRSSILSTDPDARAD
jgi:hypothetical protein